MDYKQASLAMHEKNHGKLEIKLKVPLESRDDLSTAYTPGVAEPCLRIAENPELAYKYTEKSNLVAVVSDGSAVLGLGNIGGLAGYPVMSGKACLFKRFANVDAVPICLDTQDPEEIIRVVKAIAPTFGGINLEDISAPRCFEVERRLIEALDIPVFHDDQHGTAIVVLAGLINALKIVNKKFKECTAVLSGAGSAGIAVCKILLDYGIKDVILCDTKGAIYDGRDSLNDEKIKYAKVTNKNKLSGNLETVLKGADIFIGMSKPDLLTAAMVKTMAKDSIVFALSNPNPEILPDEAKKGGARIVATGRSDFPNQINNVLAFPGIFRGALDARARKITNEMKIAAAEAIAGLIPYPTEDKIIPYALEMDVAKVVAEAVKAKV
ncbi:MAG: malic enzyme, malate dehydrogenase (oxaloacetate-decarboxylating) [Candidatus Peregrinibacteria bacterium GW2011_GWF2_33_10]|nr:MAG: malic enzyme, malate dehydrogenase (oxaloacetate-decarboxylating) [Candidatus Peregrinibacteria bacterium GW2011_GWF2_33_10]OGJ45135.1 MAG: malate dehydrogenase [Candidatus Peregrinibacteria bacterium RIFOXYA2_FULL_33_21]OGJ46505.1 MAG: malate dehydrogenase [Candidatus Peregrinibacteria bacterium RIFOXYA12_FULL_33_12]OGJ50804.1 MAG: malate dehydrogenase [Candidatus Peregrinibacteria bacterium RIFOXYB2_FULL_33_20]